MKRKRQIILERARQSRNIQQFKVQADLDNKYVLDNRDNRIESTSIDPNLFTENTFKEVHPVVKPQINIQAPGQSRATESLKTSQHNYS